MELRMKKNKGAFAGIAWYWWIVLLVLAAQAAVFAFFGQDSYIGIHDNLDIHIADYQIMKLNDAFFAHGKTLPLLGGIDRDYLASEFSLYTLLYILLPNFTAYLTGHFLKILIALGSGILLGKDVLKEQYPRFAWLVVLGSFTYSLLPLYPGFSFSFASIPLFIWLIRRICADGGKRYYLFLFLYPLVSYFTFFGLFLLGYLLCYTIWRSFQKHRPDGRLFAALCVLAAGYLLLEYRLFLLMLTPHAATIRESMVMGSDNLTGILKNIGTALVSGVFHAEDVHRFLVLPVCLLYLVYRNARYLRNREAGRILKDPFNLLLLLILFNCIVYGLYTWEGFRTLFETVLPPLKGWQFTRTVFFNPFLWYAAFFMAVKRLFSEDHRKVSVFLTLAALLVVLGKQTLYNDFYNTVYTNAYRIVKQKDTESLSYREFYSPALFERIKEDIGYTGEYAAAYGMHPAVLSYNGFSTLDGCLSYYSQSYKEEFRKVIAPALDRSETARIYFDEWGARAYLFSPADDSIWNPVKTMQVSDRSLYIDPEAFRALGGRYLLSRVELDNTEELGFLLKGVYSDPSSPYTVYVYEA